MSFVDRVGRLPEGDPAPLYLQLQKLIRDAISSGVLEQNEMIPPERDLATSYGISRITVRKTIGGLVEEGLLTRRRGSGTFVTARVEKNFSKLSSFSEDMLARGKRPSSQWIARTTGMANSDESMALGLAPRSIVQRFTRLRFADDAPLALEFSTIPGHCLGDPEDIGESLYEALEKHGNRPVRALQRLRAVPFGSDHAKLLDVDTGHAGFLIERHGFKADGSIVEFTRSYYRGDIYDFVSELIDPN
ncbi:GntR family transcriptional regulator [Novosphingobium sp. 1949]|uniref:GntR family transcriptional regulator n=1 Tax=Novosphingobium organovorum TaxID=2930092 RepID=A0ABT0BEB0_9SPHN|nr:GntR family transcriptional regulator [Novosphingobium organovorum]MCJ2183371.1 GntR family transcriptional regulator [Novosphingobium organovorum]